MSVMHLTTPDIVNISHEGRVLFRIDPEGNVSGEIEDASEAAAHFCREVQRITRTAMQEGRLVPVVPHPDSGSPGVDG